MLKCGEHPKVLQEMMGHATIHITLDTYSHVLPEMQDKAANRLGALLS
jgi:integrase